MRTSFPRSRFRWTLAAGVGLLLACAAALAADPGGLPKVVVIATGGTIAGVAASSTEFTDYKSAKVGIQALIDAIPGLRQAANVRGRMMFGYPSESDHKPNLAEVERSEPIPSGMARSMARRRA